MAVLDCSSLLQQYPEVVGKELVSEVSDLIKSDPLMHS